MSETAQVQGREPGFRPLQGKVIIERDGVQAVRRPKAVYIRLPHVKSEREYPAIFDVLQQILDMGYDKIDWIVDVSALSQVPLPLLSVLTGFRDDLDRNMHRLLLAGLRPETFVSPQGADESLFSQQRLMSLLR